MNHTQDIACLDTLRRECNLASLDKAGIGVTNEELQKRFLEGCYLPEFKDTEPTYYHLVPVRWAIFGVLTWSNPYRRLCTHEGARERLKDFNWLIKHLENALDLKRGSIAFYFKCEQGNGEGHAHFLLAETGLNGIPPELVCDTLKSLWAERGKQLNGIRQTQVKIEPFDATRQKEGVRYVCKRERDSFGNIHDTRECFSNALKGHLQPKTGR